MTSAALLAPFSVVLVVSGAAKVLRPGAVGPALAALGLRRTRLAGRLLGAAEVAAGTLALTVGGRGPTAVAALWLAGLTVVSVVLVRDDRRVPCGCFGDASVAPTLVHTVTNAVGTVLACVAALASAPSPASLVVAAPLAGSLLAGQVALGAWLLLAVYRDLPRAVEVADATEFELVDRR